MSLFVTLPAYLAACVSPLYLFNTISGELSPLICSNLSSDFEIVFLSAQLSWTSSCFWFCRFVLKPFSSWGPRRQDVGFQPFLICELLKICNVNSYCGTVLLGLLALSLLFIVTFLWPSRSRLCTINTGYKDVIVGIPVLYQLQCPSDNKGDPGWNIIKIRESKCSV